MKLSALDANKLYTLRADGVKATVQVIKPGTMPLCIVHGEVGDIIDPDGPGFLVILLIGWAPWGEDTMTPNGLQLFALDEPPTSSWLIGVVMQPDGSPEFVKLACSPTIEEHTTD